MGLKEHDSYQTVGGGGESGLPSMRRSLRSWVDDARIRVNNIIGDWDDVRGGRGGGRRSFLTRLSGGWNQCSDEHIPAFTRDLASGGTKQLVILLLCLLCVFTIVHWMLLPASVNSLVPAPSLCASQDDMYDTASRLCQVGNKYAFWYMKHKSWVQCAPNLPGYRMLTNTGPDWQGNWWYTPAQAKEVRVFYDTCIPECATDEDSYHTERDMCMVTDGVLVTYLNGDGQKCGKGTVGEQAIRTATASLSNHHRQGRYWYKADAAGRVRALLESCRGTCAKGDPTLHDNVHCQAMNNLAVQFLSGNKGTCDKKMSGYALFASLGHTKDVKGAWMYPKSTGDQIEQFYLSCMRGWKPSNHAFGSVAHAAETVGGKTLRQAQKESKNKKEWNRWDKAMMMSEGGI